MFAQLHERAVAVQEWWLLLEVLSIMRQCWRHGVQLRHYVYVQYGQTQL